MKIHVPENTKYINVMASGGADSTILLYLLAKEHPVIHCYSFKMSDSRYEDTIVPIIKYIENRLPVKIHFTRLYNTFFIRDAVEHILSARPGIVFTGCNLVVTDKFTPTIYIPGDTPPVRGPTASLSHLRPFIDVSKIDILRLYQTEEVLDLLPLTWSCGAAHSVPCGGCYFCMERAWACNELRITEVV